MKSKFLLISALIALIISVSVYANQSIAENVSVLSSGSDLRFGALLFFLAFAALLPAIRPWDDGQNGS